MKIAVDILSGERHPDEMISGVCRYISKFRQDVILIGNEEVIKKKLLLHPFERQHIEIIHTDEVITMEDSPVEGYKKKPNASVTIAARLVAEKRATGFFSPGNTGAAMTAALFEIGRIKGIHRPAIATFMPTIRDTSILVDVGANSESKPVYLQQFAMMASVLAKTVLKLENPRVGLLSNGEEESKGNELTKTVYEMLRSSSHNFIGYVEGYDIFNDRADVIVTDGFTGNIALKTAEGVSKIVFKLLKEQIEKSAIAKIGALFLKPVFYHLKKKVDAREYGGAPLLGIDGNVIIGHGNSDAKATYNALRILKLMDQFKMHEEIVNEIALLSEQKIDT